MVGYSFCYNIFLYFNSFSTDHTLSNCLWRDGPAPHSTGAPACRRLLLAVAAAPPECNIETWAPTRGQGCTLHLNSIITNPLRGQKIWGYADRQRKGALVFGWLYPHIVWLPPANRHLQTATCQLSAANCQLPEVIFSQLFFCQNFFRQLFFFHQNFFSPETKKLVPKPHFGRKFF